MRTTAIALALLTLTACQWRTTDQRIVEVDGERFICTYSINELSGNESESVCTQIIDTNEVGS